MSVFLSGKGGNGGGCWLISKDFTEEDKDEDDDDNRSNCDCLIDKIGSYSGNDW